MNYDDEMMRRRSSLHAALIRTPDPVLPRPETRHTPEPDTCNPEARADLAENILGTHYGDGSHAEAVGDLLADVRHLCDRFGVDFAEAVERSAGYALAHIQHEGPRAQPRTP